MFGRRKVASIVAEFLGTGALTLTVLTIQRSQVGVAFFIAIVAGLVYFSMVYAFSGITGSYFNPAITIGLWTARKIQTLTAVLMVGAELLGGWLVFFLYRYMSNAGGTLTPIGGHFNGRILTAEAVGAGVFALVWAAAAFKKWDRGTTAVAVGFAVMVGMIIASSAGPVYLGIINPGIALGVRAWVWGTYVAGPVIGAVVGVNLYGLLFSEEGLLAGTVANPSEVSESVVATAPAAATKASSSTRKAPAKRKTAAKSGSKSGTRTGSRSGSGRKTSTSRRSAR